MNAVRRSTLLLYVVLLGSAPGCSDPGKGATAEAGFGQAARILAAISAYEHASGAPPKSLDLLVPRYVPQSDLVLVGSSRHAYPFGYRLNSDRTFELAFRYAGPGMNECTYTSTTTRWKCSGHY